MLNIRSGNFHFWNGRVLTLSTFDCVVNNTSILSDPPPHNPTTPLHEFFNLIILYAWRILYLTNEQHTQKKYAALQASLAWYGLLWEKEIAARTPHTTHTVIKLNSSLLAITPENNLHKFIFCNVVQRGFVSCLEKHVVQLNVVLWLSKCIEGNFECITVSMLFLLQAIQARSPFRWCSIILGSQMFHKRPQFGSVLNAVLLVIDFRAWLWLCG